MKKELILVFLVVLFVIIYKQNTSSFIDENIQVVVAVYNEDMSWLKKEPFNGLDIICYNKGKNNLTECASPSCRVINLPNVGRCDHTYLYHIIENYGNLAPVTVFIPASWTDKGKKMKTLNLIEEARNNKNTNIPIQSVGNSELWGFQLDEWTSSNLNNKEKNETSVLQPCPQRPFGVWFKHNFPDTLMSKVQYNGIFAVSRDDILKNHVEHYKKFIRYLDNHSNPEAGHYIERAWYHIIFPNS
jgi:Protein of unknown function (DUF3431)